MKFKNSVLRIFLILSLVIFLSRTISTVNANSFDGLPYLCPDGVNIDEVKSSCEDQLKNMFIPNSEGLCNGQDCEKLKSNAMTKCVENKVNELNKNIEECNDKFNQVVKVYSYDWSKKPLTKEMKEYKTKTYDYGSFMIESCIAKDGFIPIYDYEEPDCSKHFEDNRLNKAMNAKEWYNNLCQFEKTYYQKIKEKSTNYENCYNGCKKKYNVDNMYKCNEENSWMYDSSQCPKIYSMEEYNNALTNSYKCEEECNNESLNEANQAKNYFYSNCLSYSFYTYQYLYNLYAQFYGIGYFSGNEKLYLLKNHAEFIKKSSSKPSLKCEEGYTLKDGICVRSSKENEKLTIQLDSKVLDLSKSKSIMGTLTYSCSGDCSGEPLVMNINSPLTSKFEIKYVPSISFLTKEKPKVRFTITPNFDSSLALYNKKESIITLKTMSDTKEIAVKPMQTDTITIIKNFKEPVDQGNKVPFSIKVNGPNNYDYTYVLSSALDGTFYYDNKEMPITALITSPSNKINLEWKTPMISRKVNAKEFYIDELGQLSSEGLSAVASTIAETVTGNMLKSGFKGHDKLIEKGLGSASAISEFSTSDPIPFGMSVVGLLHENAIASLGSSITYSTYKAYQRATKRFKAFNSDKTHIYSVPIAITVHPKGYNEIKKIIQIKVKAPEVILE